MIHYNKLIRDKIPEMMAKKGVKLSYHVAQTNEEYWRMLLEKLQEKMNEFGLHQNEETFGDILTVLDAMRDFKKLDHQDIVEIKQKKNSENGEYLKRYILDSSNKEIGHKQQQTI